MTWTSVLGAVLEILVAIVRARAEARIEDRALLEQAARRLTQARELMETADAARNASWLAIAPLLAACSAMPIRTDATEDQRTLACGAFGKLTYSRRDTAETATEIRAHNAAYAALCEPGAAKP